MEEELKKLENKYFMLQMKDRWDDSDYEYERELREMIKEVKEKING